MIFFKNILDFFPEAIILLSFSVIVIIALILRNLQLKQRVYLTNRSKDAFNQMLYATKDGYFAFFYPDYSIKDPNSKIKETCSRRLAVLLNLSNGTKSIFTDILTLFSTQDAKDLSKMVLSLKEDGLAFEKEFSTKKGKKLFVFGNKISDIEGNVFCDVIWFRDISFSSAKSSFLETSLNQLTQKNTLLEKLFNTISVPLWFRNDKLEVIYKNKAYQQICEDNTDILSLTSDISIQNLPLKARSTQKTKKATSSVIIKGTKEFFEFEEAPITDSLISDEHETCGLAINTTELNDIKRKLKENQNRQLEIFSALGTAFVVFDESQKLNFCNDAFIKLFKLEKLWTLSKPTYSQFLDILREKRIIAETSQYKTYKQEELLAFETISAPIEDLVFLTDEKTLKRVKAPYSQGGLIFAFEDISNQITQQNEYMSLLNMQKDMLNTIFDAVVIFAPDGRISFYNDSFIEMWQEDIVFLQTGPSIPELIDSQKRFFNKINDWEGFKKEFLEHLFNPSTKIFSINTDKHTIEISSKSLFDGSIIISYRQK
ncbi:MAG: PAS-domain containing protein [Alphaproteobacteria bacterium]